MNSCGRQTPHSSIFFIVTQGEGSTQSWKIDAGDGPGGVMIVVIFVFGFNRHFLWPQILLPSNDYVERVSLEFWFSVLYLNCWMLDGVKKNTTDSVVFLLSANHIYKGWLITMEPQTSNCYCRSVLEVCCMHLHSTGIPDICHFSTHLHYKAKGKIAVIACVKFVLNYTLCLK